VRTIIDLDGQLKAAEVRENAVRGVLENDNNNALSVNSLELAEDGQEVIIATLEPQLRVLSSAGVEQNVEMEVLREALARANQQLEILRAIHEQGLEEQADVPNSSK
jgi:hypothetical protein